MTNRAQPSQTTVLDSLPPGSRVAIIRLRSLGDCVLTTPAVQLLKEHRPDLRLAVVVEPRFAPVYAGNPHIEEILKPEWRAVRRFHPALTVNLHGGSRSIGLTALSGADLRAGFEHYRYQKIYNVPLPKAQDVLGVDRQVHTAEHVASAMFHLGVPYHEIPRAKLFLTGERPKLPFEGPYAVIHPMASHPDKTWPSPRFRSLAQHLQRNHGLQPVFIGGPGEDLSEFQTWPVVASAPLESIKSLLAGATLFAGNDSGPAHMAAAFGLPVVVFFGPSDPVTWSPWKTPSEVLTADGPIGRISEEHALRALDRVMVTA